MRRLAGAVWFVFWAAHGAAADPARYQVGWLDGTVSSSSEIRTWAGGDAQPEILGRRLLEGAPAVRWLRDMQLPAAAPPQMFVEFFGGDVLPGKVAGYHAAVELPQTPESACLLVELTQPLNPSGESRSLRVLPDEVRRIAWVRRSANNYQAATLFYRDGRRQPFRSLRWTDTGVRLLLEQGTVLVTWEQMAELHLPARPAWECWLDTVTQLAPAGNARLLQLETSDGLRCTTSMERFVAQATRDAKNADHWQHVIQPAWSLDRLAVPHTRTRLRVWYEANEVPLSSLEPIAHRSRHALGGAWREARANLNVQGSAMRCGGRLAAWGWGVQAYDELHFELPPIPATLRTQFGLDDLVGSGGCARGRIVLVEPDAGSKATPEVLFESPVRIGAAPPGVTAAINLPTASDKARHLALVADSVDQPPRRGVDPLDVRDVWDWYEPLIELNRAALETSLVTRALNSQTDLAAWLSDSNRSRVSVVERLSPAAPGGVRHYQLCLAPRGEQLQLARTLSVTADKPILCILLTHPESPTERPARLTVKADDKRVYETDVPLLREGRTPQVYRVPLNDWIGRDVRIELTIASPSRPTPIVWHGVALIGPPSTSP